MKLKPLVRFARICLLGLPVIVVSGLRAADAPAPTASDTAKPTEPVAAPADVPTPPAPVPEAVESAAPAPAPEATKSEAPVEPEKPVPSSELGGVKFPAVVEVPLEEGATLPDAATVIALARLRLGTDPVLDGVRTLRFSGKIFLEDGKAGELEIVTKGPVMQRTTIRVGDTTEVTVLNDFEGWRLSTNAKDPKDWQMQVFDLAALRLLRARTWEMMSFFRGIEKIGGSVRVLGLADVDGRRSYKVVFDHGRSIRYTRYFAADSGDLVLSETYPNGRVLEQGDMEVDGIRFAPELVMEQAGRISKARFESIEVNADVDDALFEAPNVIPGRPL